MPQATHRRPSPLDLYAFPRSPDCSTKRLRTFNHPCASESSLGGKGPRQALEQGGSEMRRVIWIAITTLALVLAAPASSATTTISIKRTGFVAGVGHDQPGRLGHVDEQRHDRPPGRRQRRLVRVADPQGRQVVDARVPQRRDVPLPRQPASDAEGNGRRPRRARPGHARSVGAGCEVRRDGDVDGRCLEQAGGRDGDASSSCRSARRRSRSSRRCRRRRTASSPSTSRRR